MAVIKSDIYLRIRFWWWQSFGKIKIYWHAKFRWDISIHGWDKTTSGFRKRTTAVLEFYFRFLFLPNFRHLRVILHWPTKFRQNRTTLAELWRHIDFFKMAADSHIGFDLDNIRRPPSAIVVLRLVLTFGLDRIYSFGDIAIFIFSRFRLKYCLFTPIFEGFGVYFPQMTSPIVLRPKRHFLSRKHVVWAIKREHRFDLGGRTGQSKKSQSGNISPIWEDAPTVPIRTKICVAGSLPDIIMYAKFQVEIFNGYDFTGGSNFPFSYWFLHGHYNSAALLRCLW